MWHRWPPYGHHVIRQAVWTTQRPQHKIQNDAVWCVKFFPLHSLQVQLNSVLFYAVVKLSVDKLVGKVPRYSSSFITFWHDSLGVRAAHIQQYTYYKTKAHLVKLLRWGSNSTAHGFIIQLRLESAMHCSGPLEQSSFLVLFSIPKSARGSQA